MSNQFEEAPPLPRHPTALNVPQAMGTSPTELDQTVSALPTDAHALPPPPKFPSLTDVSLSQATQAAESLTPTSPRPQSLQLSDDISSVLARDTIVPGESVAKVRKSVQHMWTESDQNELNRLLEEGEDTPVPPDVTVDDIANETNLYLVAGEEGNQATQQKSISDRIAHWLHIKRGESPIHSPRQVAPFPVILSDNAVDDITSGPADDSKVEDQQDTTPEADEVSAADVSKKPEDEAQQSETQQEAQTDDAVEDRAVPPPESSEAGQSPREGNTSTTAPVDVSRTIFGASFVTVPVTTKMSSQHSEKEGESSEVMQTTPTDVELRTGNSAHINVTDDYGLKGGHKGGVNDAAFMPDGTLITCGDDGKVCIWNMADRTVESEFTPYGGESVTMVYPMPEEEDDSSMKTIMTLSESREMCIWAVDSRQAIRLRKLNVKQSEKPLYMSIPFISKNVKARAAAAAAAAAVTTTEGPEIPASVDKEDDVNDVPDAPEAPTGLAVQESLEEDEMEEEGDKKKRFSITKVLSFGRGNSAKKAVAS